MAAVTNNALNRELGELKTRMDSNQNELREMKENQNRMESKIDTVVEVLAMSKGSIKTLVAIGSILSFIAGVLGAAAAWVFGKHS